MDEIVKNTTKIGRFSVFLNVTVNYTLNYKEACC